MACDFPDCTKPNSKHCNTCEGNYCAKHIVELGSENSCYRCLLQMLIDRCPDVPEDLIEEFINEEKFTKEVLQQTVGTEELRLAGSKIKQLIPKEKAARQIPFLFDSGIVLVGIGLGLAPTENIWRIVPGIACVILGFWMLVIAWKRGWRNLDTLLERTRALCFGMFWLTLSSAVGLSFSLGARAGLVSLLGGCSLGFLWKGMDFLESVAEALKGPGGWFGLGWFFLSEGIGGGGGWTYLGVTLGIICWLVALAWKLWNDEERRLRDFRYR